MLPIIRIAPIVALALTGCRAPEPRAVAENPAEERIDPTELEKSIFELVNRERKQRGLELLEWDSDLLPPAREHSRRMAELNFFSHEDPEYGSMTQRLRRYQVRYSKVGENLFQMSGIPNIAERTIEGWLESPGHRDILLDPELESSAIGLHRAESGRVYGTQIFRRSGW